MELSERKKEKSIRGEREGVCVCVITRGRGWKNGPIHSNTLTKIPQDIRLASCVCPPTVC